jgi:hypothetical protein
MKTTDTLQLLAALGTLNFRAIKLTDYFDASPDAQICDEGTEALSAPVAAILGDGPLADGDAVLAIVDGGRIEFHGVGDDGDPFCLALDVDRLI